MARRKPRLLLPRPKSDRQSSSSSYHLIAFLRGEPPPRPPSLATCLVSALKEASSTTTATYGCQLHSLALKSGLAASNLYVRNGLINLYGKHGLVAPSRILFESCPLPLRDTASWNIMLGVYVRSRSLDDARWLFDEMPVRDCVSFTTMVMGFSQNDRAMDAVGVFREMVGAGVAPSEVTLASVLSACARLGEVSLGRTVHCVAVRVGLDGFVFVSTNLVHVYAVCSRLRDAEAVFGGMRERNVVTWNVMLKGYCKSGLMDSARALFDRIPARDLVSWSTIIDGYLRTDSLQDALGKYGEMLRHSDARPNEVMIVDLVSVCGRLSALHEGRQFHGLILKTGLDSYNFVQATLIHLYSVCHQVEHAHLLFKLGLKDNVSSWNALLVGFIRSDMLDSAKKFFDEIPEKDVVSWSTMIAGYAQSNDHSELALELFQKMLAEEVLPNEITMVSVLSAVANSGTLERARWMHDYIKQNSIPLNDNLSAAIVDMYAKCGSIDNALQAFHEVRNSIRSISPWNAIICGLAMHSNAEKALDLFMELLKYTNIKPNSITFIGVMTACCHAGLLTIGKQHFESMKSAYGIEPNIKHYGCMIDLLGRAGQLEEARQLIESMPMEADVVIWGTVLAASRTHNNLEIGRLAAENLARLEPDHGAGRVLLSNIYASAGKWDDVCMVRKEMQERKMARLPGCSGIA